MLLNFCPTDLQEDMYMRGVELDQFSAKNRMENTIRKHHREVLK